MEINEPDSFQRNILGAMWELKRSGRWLESGTMEFESELWSYKIQKLSKKPKQRTKDRNCLP